MLPVMSKAQWRQTGAGLHGDRRTKRNRARQAQNRHAVEESVRADDRKELSDSDKRGSSQDNHREQVA